MMVKLKCTQGEIGEIVVHGPQVMKGYHNMPTETANTLRQMKDGKTWLFTGDIARMDEDGYFYIVDRKKELIKPGGFQVWPREVEEALMCASQGVGGGRGRHPRSASWRNRQGVDRGKAR